MISKKRELNFFFFFLMNQECQKYRAFINLEWFHLKSEHINHIEYTDGWLMFQSSGTEFSPANSLHRRIIPSFTNNIENFPEFNVFYFSWLQASSLFGTIQRDWTANHLSIKFMSSTSYVRFSHRVEQLRMKSWGLGFIHNFTHNLDQSLLEPD